MTRFALIDWAGWVDNVVEDPSPAWLAKQQMRVVELPPGSSVGVDWGFDEATGTFLAPGASPAPTQRHITKLAFRQRFQPLEKAGVTLAGRQATLEGANVQAYLDDVQAAEYIDLDRPDTRAGVIALEAAGLLGEGRALEILDGPSQPHEVYYP